MDEQTRQHRRAHGAREAERRLRDRAVADRLRRVIVRVVPESGPPAAAALVDVGARTIRSLVGAELNVLPQLLGDYDHVIAIGARQMLYALSIRDHDQWHLVDLGPPQKTRQLNRAGRKLLITPELLIASTTSVSRPLGDAAKFAEYLANDQTTKLRRRLESDVKALFAFYNYGVLHRCVRLRWGFLNEYLPVDWAHPGDRSVYDILNECQQSGQLVEIVCGSAPGWSDPWSRAIRVKIQAFDHTTVNVQGTDRGSIPREDIQAIRVLPNIPNSENLGEMSV